MTIDGSETIISVIVFCIIAVKLILTS